LKVSELNELYESWASSRANAAAAIKAARRLVASRGAEGWSWLSDALHDERRKWFVGAFFKSYPVPRRLVKEMIRAGVLEKNPSYNQSFIEPCVSSFGAEAVLTELWNYLESGSDEEKAGAASALYWVPYDGSVSEWRQRIRCQLLREFVNNPDVQVRRRIMPMLSFDAEKYPEELRPLTAQAIAIARSHSDEYIRHRVEIQLGVCRQ
jgi:hypothetical protein